MKTFLGIFLSLLIPTTSFSAEALIKEKREVGHFECIQIHGTGTLLLKQGTSTSLTLTATASDLPQVISKIENNCLILDTQKEAKLNGPIQYSMVINRLTNLEASGSIVINTQNPLKTPQITLSLTGSGKANIKLNNESFEGKIDGTGEITLQGKTQKQWLEISGTGVVNAKNLSTEKTMVSIAGTGRATVRALQELDVNINGAGIVQYYGNPKIHQKISGSGEIIPLE